VREGDRVVVVRHGETQWSATRRHTGRTDIALTEAGRAAADLVRAELAGFTFQLVLASPLGRALETARRAGLDPVVDADLVEWDYGEYEGRTTEEIRREIAGWSVWSHAVTGGETVDDVGHRADRIIERVLPVEGDVCIVAHAHLLRILAARWLELPPGAGQRFTLDTATVSELGFEREARVILRWNERCGSTAAC
jgi:broad specificity phosphatase PhoE